MECPACGTRNREDARFCRSCGRPFAEPIGEERAQASEEETAVGTAATGVPAPAPSPEVAQGEPSTEEAADASTKENEEQVDAQGLPPAADEALDLEPAKEEAPEVIATEPATGEIGEEPVDDETDFTELADAFWRKEVVPLEPAEAGTLLAGRYLVLEVLDAQQDQVHYLARDLQRCWQCSLEMDAPDEAFCPHCGAAQEQAPQVASEAELLQVRSEDADPEAVTGVATRFTDQGRCFLVLVGAESEPAEPAEPTIPEGIRLVAGQRSDPGQIRALNEDSVLALLLASTYESQTGPVIGFFAVADGMGGHEGGEIASKLALQVLADQVLHEIILPDLAGELASHENVLARMRTATLAANDDVYLARQKRGNDMGTTLTAALIRDRRLFLAHVGDCRAYRWGAEGLEQLTDDHSVVATLISQGKAEPDEVYTHPHRSVIYRSIGDQPTVEVDADVYPLEPGERIILCSDGLWEMVRSEGIADVMMQEADPQTACDLLVRLANAAGGEDNISVLVVQVVPA
jgi:serine/threonine protein phosphatase PrpC